MSTFDEQLDRAAAAATCTLLGQGGSALIGAGAWSLAAGGAGLVPIGIGALGVFASHLAGCWDPAAPPTTPATPIGSAGNCIEVEGGCAKVALGYDGAPMQPQGGCDLIRYVLSVVGPGDLPGQLTYNRSGITCTGNSFSVDFTDSRIIRAELQPCAGATCKETQPPDPPVFPPTDFTDPVTNCDLTVEFKGFAMLPGDQLRATYKVSPTATGLRASGGVITNCNFDPVIYMPDPRGPGGGPPPPIGPWDPSWDDLPIDGPSTPPWMDLIFDIIGGFAGNVAADAIAAALTQPVPQYQYTMRAACNYKQDGTFEDYTITLPEQPWETRVLAMQEMNIDFLQQHLLWKTPTCSGGGVGIAGDPVTVNFISDEYSPDGNDRIKKRFVYFDQTGAPLEDHVTHWKDFVWNAGPACVNLEGTPMGKCQVWASTVDEGKRVITHAAAIAGIDVADGEWKVASSRSSRYGQPGTMRVAHFTNGNYTVTKRPGPSGNPEACG